MSLVYGLITGILFGLILQISGILHYEKQLGALRLVDMTVFKLMLTAIVVGSIGIYLFKDLGVIKLSLKATSIGAQVVGGLIFGVGWALLGYCPGISAGALGEVFQCIPIFGHIIISKLNPFLREELLCHFVKGGAVTLTFSLMLTSSLFLLYKLVFFRPADRTYPIIRQVLKFGSGHQPPPIGIKIMILGRLEGGKNGNNIGRYRTSSFLQTCSISV